MGTEEVKESEQTSNFLNYCGDWIPACAGMTEGQDKIATLYRVTRESTGLFPVRNDK